MSMFFPRCRAVVRMSVCFIACLAMRMAASGEAVGAEATTTATVDGDWDNVNYEFTPGEENTVKGPNEAFTSVRPASGAWTASFGVSNHFANLGGESIRAYSARCVTFRDHNVTCSNAGKSSQLVFKISLSEPVAAAIWKIGRHGRNVAPPAKLIARYSRDGINWLDAHVYAPGQAGDYTPPPVTLQFDSPTDTIYLGWFADVLSGTGWWLVGSTGELTFAPVAGQSVDLARDAASGANDKKPAAADDLHGPRTVPANFFGTTTHVNGEGLCKLLQDLDIQTVRIDFPWTALEPSRGQYNFDPQSWVIASAEEGVKNNLDQLAVLTTPPAWSLGERDTAPNDASAAALEEFMFQLATKYKGKIRYWQANNEPNMAVWRDRFIVFLKAFYRGVKRADPENKVVLCGFAGVEHLHLSAVYRLGGKEFFDILGAHPYTRPAMPEDGGYLDRLRAIRDVMRQYGDQKPIWVDEIGWNGIEPSMLEYVRGRLNGYAHYAGTEEEQSRGLARTYLLSATVPWIERVYFFHLHQEAAYTDVCDNVDHYMGLFTPWMDKQVRPKDAYFAVKAVIRVLSQSSYKERIETPPRVWCLYFERDNEATIAIWSLDDNRTMTLSDISMLTGITSMVGTPVLVSNCLTISGRPLYLKTAASDAQRLIQQIRQAQWNN